MQLAFGRMHRASAFWRAYYEEVVDILFRGRRYRCLHEMDEMKSKIAAGRGWFLHICTFRIEEKSRDTKFD
jgi:hypothetical protein